MSALRHSAFFNQRAAKINRLTKKSKKYMGKRTYSANIAVSVFRCLYVDILFIFSEFFPAAILQIRHFHSQYIKPVNIVINY